MAQTIKYSAPGFAGLIIYADDGVLDDFLSGLAEVPDFLPGTETQNVGGHQRRAYPGDPNPASVNGHTRDTLTTTNRDRVTLPGRNFYCEKEVTVDGKIEYDVTTATFVGDFKDLLTFAIGAAQQDFVLRSPNGTPYDVVSTV
jgi:hypothetical protein